MAEKYKLEQSAKKDIKDSVIYYEERKEGLGGEFIDEVNLKILEIAEKPEVYPLFHRDARKASLKRFPFTIIYTIKDSGISIIGVWHKSRDPNQLEKRMDDELI